MPITFENITMGGLIVSTAPQSFDGTILLNYDISNPACYPGTGTTLTDLSGNGNNGELVNSPTYNANDFGGSLATASSGSRYIRTGTDFNLDNNFTVSVIANISSSQSYWATLWGNDNFNSSQGYWALQSNSNNLYFGKMSATFANNTSFSGSVQNALRVFDFTYDGTTAIIYFNGSAVASSNIGAPPTFTTNGIFFGGRHQNSGAGPALDIMNAKFYQMRVFASALTAQQILTNYNTVKSKYNL